MEHDVVTHRDHLAVRRKDAGSYIHHFSDLPELVPQYLKGERVDFCSHERHLLLLAEDQIQVLVQSGPLVRVHHNRSTSVFNHRRTLNDVARTELVSIEYLGRDEIAILVEEDWTGIPERCRRVYAVPGI